MRKMLGAQVSGGGGVPHVRRSTTGRRATTQIDVLRGRLGFTLLEVTISITLLLIIVLIISGALRLGFRSITAGEKKVESIERLRTSISIITAQIQSGLPLTASDQGVGESYFQGSEKSLQLSTNYSVWGGQRGYVVVAYRVERNANGKEALYATEHIVGMETSRETKLLDAFDEIRFEYSEQEFTGQGDADWVAEWTDDTTIPAKVRLRLVSGTKEHSMIIPIRVRGPSLGVRG